MTRDEVLKLAREAGDSEIYGEGKVKDHEFRELVNTLRDVAVAYHDHQSLRERIRRALSDSLKKQTPVAWADDKAFSGGVGNVASAAAKAYWEKSNWADRESAKRLRHPLYALAPVPQAPSVPDGWQLVPIKPTPEMLRALVDGANQYDSWDAGYRGMLAAATMPARAASNPIGVEAVCVVVDGLDGKRLDWLIEGGLGDLPEGATLIFAHQAITDADGWGEVFLAAPAA